MKMKGSNNKRTTMMVIGKWSLSLQDQPLSDYQS
jgi:hypothetical protein